MSDDIALLSAAELIAGYRDGSLSPVEATEAALARIEAHDGKFNAFRLVDTESALKAARTRNSAGTSRRRAAASTACQPPSRTSC